MKYTAIFFDLDGTLMDTSEGIIHATETIIRTHGLETLNEEEKRRFIGPSIQDSLRDRYRITKEYAWKLATEWRNIYKEKYLLEATPYEGIYEVLHFCQAKRIKTGVATNKREDYATKLLDHYGFAQVLDCIAGTDFAGKRKKVNLIQICMAKVGVTDPQNCLMVGDTEGDLEAAKKANVDFLGVSYGYGFSVEDARKVNLVHSCREILDYLQV